MSRPAKTAPRPKPSKPTARQVAAAYLELTAEEKEQFWIALLGEELEDRNSVLWRLLPETIAQRLRESEERFRAAVDVAASEVAVNQVLGQKYERMLPKPRKGERNRLIERYLSEVPGSRIDRKCREYIREIDPALVTKKRTGEPVSIKALKNSYAKYMQTSQPARGAR